MLPIFAAFVFHSIWVSILAILAFLLLLSGADDMVPLLICAYYKLCRKPAQTLTFSPADQSGQRRLAIFVPCWKEAAVIGEMIRSNLARIRYTNFDFFVGVYPNDQPTSDAAFDAAAGISNVHVVVCPRPGPTSKADCLNAIYHGMNVFEETNGARFDTIVLHDAEDVIHADAFNVIGRERARYEMVQIPVLPLSTPFFDFTHGIYCDEFAEFQLIDMPARQYSHSFIPSNGVGTGFDRQMLERLAARHGGEIFDPSSLTEDYDIGVQFHCNGLRQLFFPLKRSSEGILATREYFPRKVRSAIRQRTRWITGIALQSWERHGWQGSWRAQYWFWRDRKGLVANPLSLLTNILFFAGLTDWMFSIGLHRPWLFGVSNPRIVMLCLATAGLQVFRLILRSVCVGRMFGTAMGLTVVLRCFHANFINCAASLCALKSYAYSRFGRKSLSWAKTDHAYPLHAARDLERVDLGEVLIKCGFASEAEIEKARRALPSGEDLADFLLTGGILSEHDLCRAMSLQSGLPWTVVDMDQVSRQVLRNFPARLEKDFQVLPFRVSGGRLHVATTRVPETRVFEMVSRFTRLMVEFQLVTRINYSQLRDLL